ncbi:MAG: M48 family metalloprotease, partial [Candidatus Nanopelagicales bacterium]
VGGADVLLILGLSVDVSAIGLKFGPWGGFKAIGYTHGLVLLLPVAIAILWFLRSLRRAGRGRYLGRGVATEPAPEHPLRVALERLAALADVPVPPLLIVASPRPNSYVVVEVDGVQTICVTTAAVERCSPAELDAMLAHELFHIAHGDAPLMARLEAIAELADDKVVVLSGWIVPPVRNLMRQRELSADRAAALLTGRPGDLDSAVRTCTDGSSAQPDLRVALGVPFVEASAPESYERRTHPSVHERAESLARVAAQLGLR